MDSFWFSVNSDIVINPFDFVTVGHIFNTRTVGIIKEVQASDVAGTLARVAVMANTGIESKSGKVVPIAMPVRPAESVRFANETEVIFALGIPHMNNPIPAGVIEMSNGVEVPVSLDISYLLGPDTAHVNAAGISGNQKTSYLFFLLHSAHQRFVKDGAADNASIVIFNTKEKDLLQIDEKREAKENTRNLYDLLELKIRPFENVTYFLPRGKDGRPNSAVIPENSRTYSFELKDVYDRLELLFGNNDDSYNISAILNFIYEAWPLTSRGKRVMTWSDLSDFRDYPPEVVESKSTLVRFHGHLQRFRKSPMFRDQRITSTYLGKEIKKIRPGDVFVIDIAMIPTLEEQAFVVGDVMKSIDELYSTRQVSQRTRYVLIFVDEINRFVPQSGFRRSAVAEHIMRTIVTGRSRGSILFSAQQFKSTVDPALHEGTGLHLMAKLGVNELSAPPYSMIDESTKANIVRLSKGELVMVHPALLHPIKIAFPKVPFKTS
jgi:DNA helicase HerA-like ATPase